MRTMVQLLTGKETTVDSSGRDSLSGTRCTYFRQSPRWKARPWPTEHVNSLVFEALNMREKLSSFKPEYRAVLMQRLLYLTSSSETEQVDMGKCRLLVCGLVLCTQNTQYLARRLLRRHRGKNFKVGPTLPYPLSFPSREGTNQRRKEGERHYCSGVLVPGLLLPFPG